MPALSALEIQLSLENARLQSDIGKAVRSVEGMARDFKQILGGISVVWITNEFKKMVTETINAADAMNDLRTRSGLTGQELLVLQGAAIRGGQTLESISDVTGKLSKRLGAVELGSGEAARGFAAIGMSAQRADGSLKSVSEIMREAGERFSEFDDGMNKSQLAIAIFGKGGDKLIPVIEGIKETEERMKRLGITIDENFISAADRYNDRMADINALHQVLSRMIVQQLLPYMEKYQEWLEEAAKSKEKMALKSNILVNSLKGVALVASTVFNVIASLSSAMAGAALSFQSYGEGMLRMWTAIGMAASGNMAGARMMAQSGQGSMAEAVETWNAGLKEAQGHLANIGKAYGMLFGDTQPRFEEKDNWDRMGKARKPAPGLPDLKGMEAAASALRTMQEALYKAELDRIKDQAQRRLQVLDDAYGRYLIGEHEYWDTKGEIQHAAFAREIALLQQQQAQEMAFAASQKAGTKERVDAEKALMETSFKIIKLQEDAAHASKMNYLGAAKAAEDYQRMLQGIEAQLLSLQGKELEAERLRVAMSQREMRQRAMANGDTETVATLDEIAERSAKQHEFNTLRGDAEMITERLRMSEQRLQDSVRVGAISEFEGLRRTGDMRREAAEALERYADTLRKIAEEQNNEKMKLQVDQLIDGVRRLRSESNLLGEKIASVFTDSFSNASTDFVTGTRKMSEAFGDFAKSVVRNLVQMQSQAMAKSIFGSIGGGEGGGLFSGIGSFFSNLLGRADGGPVSSGQSYIVGERGPELFTPGISGTITPNGSVGGVTIVQNIHIDSRSDQASIRAAMQQATQNALLALQSDINRGGSFSRSLGVA